MRKSGRPGARLAWTMGGVSALLLSAGALGAAIFYPPRGLNAVVAVMQVLSIALFAALGTVIISRSPRNPIGWLLWGMGIVLLAAFSAVLYADYALLVEPGSLRGGHYAAWVLNWIYPLAICPIGGVMLVFPHGRTQSRAWSNVAKVLAAGLLLSVFAAALTPGRLTISDYDIENPLGIAFLDGVGGPLLVVAAALMAVAMLAAALSVVLRFRRASGEERSQFKWLAAAGVLIGIGIIAVVTGGVLEQAATVDSGIVNVLEVGAIMTLNGIPIACAVAILRYRLYDIDLVINRALVYALLTAVLIGTYFVGVLVFRTVLDPITGDNDIAIAASTLAVAALFGPARRSIQSFIDRRFYRERYDAQRTLESFAARLRDEVDLESVTSDLVRVVHDTVQPRHASVWLRPQGGRP